VDGAVDSLVWSSKILRAFQGRDVVAPEFGLVGEAGVLGIKIEMHLAYSTICHTLMKQLLKIEGPVCLLMCLKARQSLE